MSDIPTRVALLTPPGRGAVATVAVSGRQATSYVGQLFYAAAGRPLEALPCERIIFGRWGSADGEELVVCRMSETEVEVHCHGGHAAAAEVIRSLVALGAQEIGWTEWFARHEAGTLQAEALAALAEARTERAAAVLLDQYRGALATALAHIGEQISRGELARALIAIEGLLARAPLGLHLTTAWRVVIAGAPNVGKSSLLNALVGYERAIVYDHPGTTRDVLRALTACDGWPVELADTAGLGAASDAMEEASMVNAEAEIRQADLVLHVLDATAERGHSTLPCEPERALTVLNKCDLLAVRPQPVAGATCVSAQSGLGLADLIELIGKRLVPAPPESGAATPFLARHVAGLKEAHAALERGDTAAASQAVLALVSPPLAR